MDKMLIPTTDADWVIAEQHCDQLRESSRESRFSVSNGFLGVRGTRGINRFSRGQVPPHTWVAGLFDLHDADPPVPGLVPAPDWLSITVALRGEKLAYHRTRTRQRCRVLDVRRGIMFTDATLTHRASFSLRARSLHLVSLDDRCIGLQLAQFTIEHGEGELTLQVGFANLDTDLITRRMEPGVATWSTYTTPSQLGLAAAVVLEVDGREQKAAQDGPFEWSWRWNARSGQTIRLQRYVALVRTDDGADPGEIAHARLGTAQNRGWRSLITAHEVAWAARWQASDIIVNGDPAAQRALRFAIYHLNGAANPGDPTVSIAARALTGSDYRGHVFWDTEIFLLPFYTLTWPDAACALLHYRFRTLDAARRKAAASGWKGAMYAWESADTGDEVTPDQVVGPDRTLVDVLCGHQEQHITADVAYAVWQYWLATADEAFMAEAGCEIILETARFWASRALPEPDGRRHIRGVIGPDEYHETIDDNAFTNQMARWNILCGIEIARLISDRLPLAARLLPDSAELAAWAEAASTIATGFDPATGLFEQFAGYFAREHIDLADYSGRSVPMDVVLGRDRTAASQVVKQADVVALLALQPDLCTPAQAATNFAYYAPRCAHGSSLSRAMHALVAARLGQPAAALSYFLHSAAIDLEESRAAIDGGIHIAALGGVWFSAVHGFAGLTLRPDRLCLSPSLPPSWHSLHLTIQWHGRSLAIAIDSATRMLSVRLLSGETMTLDICGQAHRLAPGRPVQAGIA